MVITGTGFTGATGVTFGGGSGTSFSVVNATTINVTTPAGAGQIDVVVQHPGGDATLSNGFAYTPTVTSLDVITGAAAGGTAVVVTGTGAADARAQPLDDVCDLLRHRAEEVAPQIGLVVVDLRSEARCAINAGESFRSGSLYKLIVLAEAYEQEARATSLWTSRSRWSRATTWTTPLSCGAASRWR